MFDKYLIPIQEQLFALSDYLHALPSLRNNDNIDRVDFIPPRIGNSGGRMSEEPAGLPPDIQINSEELREFLSLQQQEIALRRDQMVVRQEEVKSNERIALASIAA